MFSFHIWPLHMSGLEGGPEVAEQILLLSLLLLICIWEGLWLLSYLHFVILMPRKAEVDFHSNDVFHTISLNSWSH